MALSRRLRGRSKGLSPLCERLRFPDSDAAFRQVPSKLHYRLDAQGTYVVDAWGYQVQGDDDLTFEWFKLLLLRDEEVPEHLKSSRQIAQMKLRLRKIQSEICPNLAYEWTIRN